MSFSQAIGSSLRNYVGFTGRATRSEYWYFALFVVIAGIVALILDLYLFPLQLVVLGIGPLEALTSLGLFLPSLAVAVRRLHDIDRTGWWAILYLTGIGTLWLIYWACRRGTVGPNRFGPDLTPAPAAAVVPR
jgi:uncharacterized membrane protein YhaH (DUF805 family)